jgi:hypothetical protein
VGWLTVNPVITLHLSGLVQLDTLRVHVNDSGLRGVRRFRYALIRLSENGNTFPVTPPG